MQMNSMLMAFSVLLLLAGHVIKSKRWKQIISIYEDVDLMDLLSVMSVGQAINMVIPFRCGDLYRIWRVGKKKLNNGYILALATVFTDVFIDVITVGLAFVMLYCLNIHRNSVRSMAVSYGVLSLVVIVLCILMVTLKKYVKTVILYVAEIFNKKIERRILMAAYTVFASMKDVFGKKNIKKIVFYTAGVWVCYFLSYDLFAAFLQRTGYDFTLTGVFKTIFSMSGDALFIECLKTGGRNAPLFWFALYLFAPLVILILFVGVLRTIGTKGTKPHKSSRIIPQINESDRLAFLNIYFSEDGNRAFFDTYLSINRDISVLQDCSAGSNAKTILAMAGDSTFYRKYAFGPVAKKLHEQIKWLETHMDLLPLCRILKTYGTDDVCYYDMEYSGNAAGFFKYIHAVPVEKSWKILSGVLDTLEEKLYSGTARDAKKECIKKYIREKVQGNFEGCAEWCRKYFKELYAGEFVFINGKKYHNIAYYKKLFTAEHLLEVFGNDRRADIHGDLTVENIICLPGEKQSWYLIDPNTGNVHESPFLDYAKMLQSLHGKYEFLMLVNDVKVEGNRIEFLFTGSTAYQQLYEKYKGYLHNHFSLPEVKSIYYHEAVHWLRLMPYKIRKDPKHAVIFYAGMLMVFNDINGMFE